MPTKVQSRVGSLSERAQGILHRLLDQQAVPEAIARVLYLQTRESVSPAAITRYASRYRQRQQEQRQVQQKMDGFIARATQEGITISDLLRAVLIEKFSEAQRDGTLPKKGLLDLEAAERRRGEFELKRKQAQLSAEHRQRELDLKERQTKLAERRFQFDREKAQATLDRLSRKADAGRPLSRDDLRRIKEIYGLYEDALVPEAPGTKKADDGNS